jgi:hypothetical protein
MRPELLVPKRQDLAESSTTRASSSSWTRTASGACPRVGPRPNCGTSLDSWAMPLDVMAYLAVTAAQGAMPGDPIGWLRQPRVGADRGPWVPQTFKLLSCQAATGME